MHNLNACAIERGDMRAPIDRLFFHCVLQWGGDNFRNVLSDISMAQILGLLLLLNSLAREVSPQQCCLHNGHCSMVRKACLLFMQSWFGESVKIFACDDFVWTNLSPDEFVCFFFSRKVVNLLVDSWLLPKTGQFLTVAIWMEISADFKKLSQMVPVPDVVVVVPE
jgi:hypothetical protein